MKSLVALNEKRVIIISVNIDNLKFKIAMVVLLSLPVNYSFARTNKSIKTELKKDNLSYGQVNALLNQKILSDSSVTSDKNTQSFRMNAYALHTKKCKKVLRKISLFENYQDWIGFVKKSTYNEKAKLLTIKAEHLLLPFPMLVHIIVDRPTKVGSYHFVFPTGIFPGLRGEFKIKEINDQCYFSSYSHWTGKKTKIPNFIIELFSETLSKIGGEVLMRKTR